MRTTSQSQRVLERDCQIDYIRVRGPGGQHRNRRETGVRLRHLPSGLQVMATERRSQRRNLELAFERLQARLEERERVAKPRVETKIPRSVRRRRLETKRRRSQVKEGRRRPPWP